MQAELDGMCQQQAKQAQQWLTGSEKKVQASKRQYGKMKEKHKELHEAKTRQLIPTLIIGGRADESNSQGLVSGNG